MRRISLATNFCGVRFYSPLISASGIVVDVQDNIKLAKIKGIGGITTKSYTPLPRQGHPLPVICSFKVGYINAVGFKNPGIKIGVKETITLKKTIKKPVIASIFGGMLSEFGPLASQISKAKPDFIELDLSCPNVDDEFGKPFALDPLLSAMTVIESKKLVKDIPIIAKLSANTPYVDRVAFEVEKAGADAISAINTIGPGMLINFNQRKPILSNRVGGISGPAIRPLALSTVNIISKTVKIPIIGMGGISTGKEALEMIMAGATLVGIGSAIYQDGYEVFDKVVKEIKEIMIKYKIKSLNTIRGVI